MTYDLVPLRSYVRFYQSVVAQLATASTAVERTNEAVVQAMQPFDELIGAVSRELFDATFTDRKQQTLPLRNLWTPQDPTDLQGLTDVYEVVGRFSFQGPDNENLAKVQAIVSAVRNDVLAQRSRLAELYALSQKALAEADRLHHEETRQASQTRATKLAQFDVLAAAVHQRARQTSEAVHAVAVPQLADVQTAAEQYLGFVRKLDQVYQTCLPFLRKAIGQLFDYAGCEAPTDWPDTLPLQAELPEQLLSVPPKDSPALTSARTYVKALQQEGTELVSTRNELHVAVQRLDGDLKSLRSADEQAVQQIESASALVDYASKLAHLAQVRENLAKLEQQKADRTQAIGDLYKQAKQIETQGMSLEQDLAQRRMAILEAIKQLEAHTKAEPAFLGKDTWRARLTDKKQQLEKLKTAFSQRETVVNQLRVELSSVQVQIQTEQAQSSLVDRWLAQAQVSEKQLVEQTNELDVALGATRAVRNPTIEQAEHLLAEAQTVRVEVQQRIETLSTEQRRAIEQIALTDGRAKQVDDELAKMNAFVQSAEVAATQGFEEAMLQLAKRRHDAVSTHVANVLQELDTSLGAVNEGFIDPARAVMLQSSDMLELRSRWMRENAAGQQQAIEGVFAVIEEDLLATDEMMSKVQRDFCDVAHEACRNAWG